MVTGLKLTNPIHVYTHPVVLEFYLAFSWNPSGMQLFNSFLTLKWPFLYILDLLFFF